MRSDPKYLNSDALGRIASLVTVRDIFTPFIASFDTNRPVEDVWQEWMELSIESECSPMNQFALAVSDGKPVGILAFEDLDAGKVLSTCAREIRLDMLVTEDTPLAQAARMFAEHEAYFFVVIRGNEFVGWLSYHDLYKLPFRLCLFAALLSIEERMLSVIQKEAARCLSRLSKGRQDAARKLYHLRGFKLDELGHEEPRQLVTCTTFIDKATMIQQSHWIKAVPAASERKWMNLAERVRNKLAHPSPDEGSFPLVDRKKFGGFLTWLERLGEQLAAILANTANE